MCEGLNDESLSVVSHDATIPRTDSRCNIASLETLSRKFRDWGDTPVGITSHPTEVSQLTKLWDQKLGSVV